jgi:hypothetical protein
MTDDEWLACDSPTRMRGHIRARSFRAPRWVLFDLACVGRVRDLLGPRYRSYVDAFDGRDESTLRGVEPSATHLDGLRGEGRALGWLRTDPLREAKEAAARAVLSLGSYAERRTHAALVRVLQHPLAGGARPDVADRHGSGARRPDAVAAGLLRDADSGRCTSGRRVRRRAHPGALPVR